MQHRRLAAAMAGVALFLSACDRGKDQAHAQPAPPPPAVGVVAVELKPVRADYTFIGRVEAINTVALRARVEGFLEARKFIEGDEVKTGQLLYVIEKDMFEAQVQQFEAQVAAAKATLANAEIEYQRALSLVKNQNVPQAQVDLDKATRDQNQAQVMLSQAQLRQAQINLGYTDITAPIDGKISATNFDVGNLVNPASGTLATIVSQDPMYLTFPVSERELLAIRQQRKLPSGSLIGIEFLVKFADGSTYPERGKWDFTSPQVDQTTDTVMMRATIANPQRLLIAGQYVNVILQHREPQETLVVPQAALQVDQLGIHVLVVGKDDKVEARPIEVGQPDGTDIVVKSGLKPGERIIVDGLQKVRPGQAVQVAAAQPAMPPGSSGSAQTPETTNPPSGTQPAPPATAPTTGPTTGESPSGSGSRGTAR